MKPIMALEDAQQPDLQLVSATQAEALSAMQEFLSATASMKEADQQMKQAASQIAQAESVHRCLDHVNDRITVTEVSTPMQQALSTAIEHLWHSVDHEYKRSKVSLESFDSADAAISQFKAMIVRLWDTICKSITKMVENTKIVFDQLLVRNNSLIKMALALQKNYQEQVSSKGINALKKAEQHIVEQQKKLGLFRRQEAVINTDIGVVAQKSQSLRYGDHLPFLDNEHLCIFFRDARQVRNGAADIYLHLNTLQELQTQLHDNFLENLQQILNMPAAAAAQDKLEVARSMRACLIEFFGKPQALTEVFDKDAKLAQKSKSLKTLARISFPFDEYLDIEEDTLLHFKLDVLYYECDSGNAMQHCPLEVQSVLLQQIIKSCHEHEKMSEFMQEVSTYVEHELTEVYTQGSLQTQNLGKSTTSELLLKLKDNTYLKQYGKDILQVMLRYAIEVTNYQQKYLHMLLVWIMQSQNLISAYCI